MTNRGAWAGAASGVSSIAQAQHNVCGARVVPQFPTGSDVLLLQLAGSEFVEVNGELVPFVDGLGASTVMFDRTTDHTILPDGSDSGAAAAPSTIYGVYLSNSSVAFGPKSLRLGPFTPQYFAGAPYLGNAGTAANWRYLGAAFSDAGQQFNDSGSAREVVNLYNKRARSILLQPGYVNDNAQTTYVLNSAVWTRMAAGVNDSATYLDLGPIQGMTAQNGPEFHLSVSINALGGTCRFGIGIDSATTPANSCFAVAGSVVGCSHMPSVEALAATQRRTVYMLGVTTGGACTIIADVPRLGAASDPPATRLVGQIWG